MIDSVNTHTSPLPLESAGQLKHTQVRRAISDLVAKSPRGAKLPTIREIMRRYSVSQATADRSLQDLESAGRIRREVGRGTFVCHPTASKLNFVDLIFFEDHVPSKQSGDHFHSEVLLELGKILGARGAGMRVCSMGIHALDVSAFENLIFEKKMTHVVLINARETVAEHILKREEVRYISLFGGVHEKQPNSMQIDNTRIMRLAIDHLLDLKHRKISYLHWVNDVYYRDASQRREAFYRLVLEKQISFHSEWVAFGGFDADSGYAATHHLLSLPERPTAIIAGDETCPGVYRAIGDAGLKVGRDVSVVGINDLAFTSCMDPPLTTVRIARKRVAEMIVDALEAPVEHGAQMPFQDVPTDLVVRLSTGAAVF